PQQKPHHRIAQPALPVEQQQRQSSAEGIHAFFDRALHPRHPAHSRPERNAAPIPPLLHRPTLRPARPPGRPPPPTAIAPNDGGRPSTTLSHASTHLHPSLSSAPARPLPLAYCNHYGYTFS